MVMTTTPVRSMRSLHAFVDEANGSSVCEPASGATSSPAAGRRLHAQRDQEPNSSHGDAGVAARAGADRVTAKGELWR